MKCFLIAMASLFLIRAASAQPVEGPYTLLDSSYFVSPRFAVYDGGLVRVFWNSEDDSLHTLLYDWTSGQLVQPPHVVYFGNGFQPIPRDVRCYTDSDWEVILEERVGNVYWDVTPRILLIVSSANGIRVDTVIASEDAIIPNIPFTQYKAWQLRERPGGGSVALVSQQEAQFGDDYFFATDYPGAGFLDTTFHVESIVVSGAGTSYDTAPLAGTVITRDSVVYLRSVDYDTTHLISLSASGAWSGPHPLSCPRQWVSALAHTLFSDLVLFSSSGTYRIHADTGCDSLGASYWPDAVPHFVDERLGAAFVDGPTGANYIALHRGNVDGSEAAPLGLVQVIGEYPETRQYEAVGISDSVVYVLWTFGRYWESSGIGMFRVGWSDVISAVHQKGVAIPNQILLSAYPNPFNNSVRISYDLPKGGEVRLSVFDVLGRNVETLVNQTMVAGSHNLTWSTDGPSGIYFVQLHAGNETRVQKLMFLK